MNDNPEKSEDKTEDEFTDLKKKWTSVNRKINSLTKIQRYSTFERKVQELFGNSGSNNHSIQPSLLELHKETRALAGKYESQAMEMMSPQMMDTAAILYLLDQYFPSNNKHEQVLADRADPKYFSGTFLFSRNPNLDEPGYPFTAPLIDKLKKDTKEAEGKLTGAKKEIRQIIELRRKAARLRKFYLFVNSPLTSAKHPVIMKNIHLELILRLNPEGTENSDQVKTSECLMKRYKSLYPASFETLYQFSSNVTRIITNRKINPPQFAFAGIFVFGSTILKTIMNEIPDNETQIGSEEAGRIFKKIREDHGFLSSPEDQTALFIRWLNSRLDLIQKLKNRQLEEYVPVQIKMAGELLGICYSSNHTRKELGKLLVQDPDQQPKPESKLAEHLKSLKEVHARENTDPRALILFAAKYGWLRRGVLTDAVFPLAGIKKSQGNKIVSRFEIELCEKQGRGNFNAEMYAVDINNGRLTDLLERLLLEAHSTLDKYFQEKLKMIATKLSELNIILKEHRKFTRKQLDDNRIDTDSVAVNAVKALINKVCSGAALINSSSLGQEMNTNVRNKDKRALQYFMASWNASWLEYTADKWYDNKTYNEDTYFEITDTIINRKGAAVTEDNLLKLMEWCGKKYREMTAKSLKQLREITRTTYLDKLNEIDKKDLTVDEKILKMESECVKMLRNACRLHENPESKSNTAKKLPPKEPSYFPGTMAIHLFFPKEYPLVSGPVIKTLAYYRNLHKGEKGAQEAWAKATIDPESPESWKQVADYRKFWSAVRERCTNNIRTFDRFMHGTNNHLRKIKEENKKQSKI